jgi:hypothetical protein
MVPEGAAGEMTERYDELVRKLRRQIDAIRSLSSPGRKP